eukprot:COSAG03_NODE_14861_length_449_cov_1.322857_2_plen_43_part_01
MVEYPELCQSSQVRLGEDGVLQHDFYAAADASARSLATHTSAV